MLHSERDRARHAALVLYRPAVAVLLVLAMAGCGFFISGEERVERAGEHLEHGRFREAMLELKTLLESEPDNIAGRMLLARVSLQLGDAATAEKEVRRARELGGDATEVQQLWYATLLSQGKYDEILASLDAGDPALAREASLALRAAALMGANRHADAEAVYRQLASIGGNPSAVAVGLARALVGQGKAKEGVSELDRVLAIDANFADAWQAKGAALLALADYAGAAGAFERALALQEGRGNRGAQVGVLAGLIESRLRGNDVERARPVLARLEALAKNLVITAFYQGRVALQAGDVPAAVAALERVVAADPKNQEAVLSLGYAKLLDGNLGQAEEYLRRVVVAEPGNVRARKLLASVHIRQGRPLDAVQSLQPVLDTPDQQATALVAQARLLQGNYEEAVGLFERSSDGSSDDVGVAMGLAASYLASGAPERAIAVLEKVPDGAVAGFRKEQLLVLAHAAGKDLEAARAEVEKLVQENDDNAEVLILAGTLLASLGDVNAGDGYLSRALELAPDNVQAHLARARMHFRRDDRAGARASLERVRVLQPTSAAALVGLAQLTVIDGDIVGGMALLEEAVRANPGAAGASLLLARLHLARGEMEPAERLAREALAAASGRAQIENSAGEVLLGVGKAQDALELFRRAHASSGVPEYGLNVARAHLDLNEIPAARAQLESLVAARPDWFAAKSLLARIDVLQGNPDAALAVADELIAAQPGSGDALLLKGDILMNQERFAEALAQYERALAGARDGGVAVRALQARQRAGMEDPDRPLREWLAKHEDDAGARLVLAQHYMSTARQDDAVTHYEFLYQQTPDNPVVLNNLAWIYHARGDGRALDLARRANDLAPNTPEIADTLGWILLQAGRVDDALPLLRAAAGGMPGSGDVNYHLGAALAQKGQRAEAADLLRKAVGSAVLAERSAAEKLLAELQQQ
jgi:putative PEP-CTERM system TPR-repeat lipoprotein